MNTSGLQRVDSNANLTQDAPMVIDAESVSTQVSLTFFRLLAASFLVTGQLIRYVESFPAMESHSTASNVSQPHKMV
jgi:hypothetical protein